MALLPFYQVAAWVDSFLKSMQLKGLAGNITTLPLSERVDDEQALWTGEKYRLAFCGEPKDFRLELRELVDGVWQVKRSVNNPAEYPQLVYFLVTEEG